MTVGWEIEVRGRGSQQMPPQRDREMEKYTQICKNTHMMHVHGFLHCRKPCTCTPAQIHADVNTHRRLIKHARKHAHIHLPLFHTLSYSVSPPQLHPWGTIWTVLSVATMRTLLWDKLLLYFFFSIFTVGKVNVSQTKLVLLLGNRQSVRLTNWRSSYCASGIQSAACSSPKKCQCLVLWKNQEYHL